MSTAVDRPASTLASIRVERIPDELKALPRWVAWRYEWDGKRWTKIPVDPATGEKASTTDPSAWSSFEDAFGAAKDGDLDGVGFVFAEKDGFVGIDLDDCLGDDGHPVPEAREIIDAIDSYTEVSPSGKGVKIFVRGTLPGGGKGRRTKPETFGQIEVYCRSRFFTLTGWELEGTPAAVGDRQPQIDALLQQYFPEKRRPPEAQPPPGGCHAGFPGSDDDLIALASRAANGAKFTRLWAGDAGGYPSQSEADLALVSILAFYAGPDRARIDRIFRRSKLCPRKWLDREDYRANTIAKALDGRTEFYSGQPHDELAGAPPAGERVVPPVPRRETPLGCVLSAVRVDRKPKSLHVSYRVECGEEAIAEVTVTTAKRGVKDAIDRLAEIIADHRRSPLRGGELADLRRWAGSNWMSTELEADAAAFERRQAAMRTGAVNGGRSMAVIAVETMRGRYGLAFRSHCGRLWSESLGRLVDFTELTRLGGSALLEAVKEAHDYAPPTGSNPSRHVRHLEAFHRTAWGDLSHALPDELRADLGPDSRAAADRRARIAEIFNITEVWKRTRSDGIDAAERTSLAAIVRGLVEAASPSEGPRWQRILRSVDAWAWITIGKAQGGTRESPPILHIAIRPQLFRGQVGRIAIPSLADPKALRALGRRYGFAEQGAAPDDRVPLEGGGRVRAVVLGRAFSREIVFEGAGGDEPETEREVSSDGERGDWTEGSAQQPETPDVPR